MRNIDNYLETYNILKHQIKFNWQKIVPYNEYENSLVAHAYKHPIGEKTTGKWDDLINFENEKTIIDSYYNISEVLSKKYGLGEAELYYKEEAFSYNILDSNTNLMVCLKFRDLKFDIASCYFPSYKIIKLFSPTAKLKKKYNFDDVHFIPYREENLQSENNTNIFEEAMSEFFGKNSTEYAILFNNKTIDIDDIIENIKKDISNYLKLMENLIKNEDDKQYFFVYNDGIDYIIRLSLLYKIKDNSYERLYNGFLNIDINNLYKEALDICKKYIDEGENNSDS